MLCANKVFRKTNDQSEFFGTNLSEVSRKFLKSKNGAEVCLHSPADNCACARSKPRESRVKMFISRSVVKMSAKIPCLALLV